MDTDLLSLKNTVIGGANSRSKSVTLEALLLLCFLIFLFIGFRAGERNMDLLFHLFRHSWDDSGMFPDQDRTHSLGTSGRL